MGDETWSLLVSMDVFRRSMNTICIMKLGAIPRAKATKIQVEIRVLPHRRD